MPATLWTARLLALAGFLDAAYLTASHYAGAGLACGPGGGCELVTASRFATLGGVPIAAIGVVYYVLANLLVWTPAAAWGRSLAGGLVALTGAATAVSAVLFTLQAAVIHAWCRFCLLSAAITVALFACSLALLRHARRETSAAMPVLLALAWIGIFAMPAAGQERPGWVLVVHGGAGDLDRAELGADEERAHREAMTESLRAGAAILERGGSSLDAVEAALRVLEDDPHFNAGRGAVLTSVGTAELDASIMDGRDRRAGAVAGVRHVKNPISLARLVMEKSVHVMLAREGAEEFALEQGVELLPADYFVTEGARRSLERVRQREAAADSASADTARVSRRAGRAAFGTVGAVALDREGHLAAATSTGGMTNKRWGRIGDSPIIGAGTYADDLMGCAVSATGHGEFFIRNAVAHDICARAHYTGIPLRDAADQVVMEDLVERGGSGGVIALDRDGAIAMPFNSTAMFRGHLTSGGEPIIEIFRD